MLDEISQRKISAVQSHTLDANHREAGQSRHRLDAGSRQLAGGAGRKPADAAKRCELPAIG